MSAARHRYWLTWARTFAFLFDACAFVCAVAWALRGLEWGLFLAGVSIGFAIQATAIAWDEARAVQS